MPYPFSTIIILYNPKSTGNSASNAKSLKDELDKKLPNVTVHLKKTEYAGHAEAMGEEYAKKDGATLLVSSSGDGGYNELINGVMKYATKKLAVCVLPSGNANDHHNSVSGTGVGDIIVAGKITKLDIIEVKARKDGKSWSQHAHSYVGIGLTAYIGKKLTEAKLTPINEKWLVLKYLLKFQHSTLRLKGDRRWRNYSSVVFGNIDRMSKIIKLSDNAKVDDGLIEVYAQRSRSTLGTVVTMGVVSAIGMKTRAIARSFSFESKRAFQLQCDGEVFELEPGKITVTVEPSVVRVLRQK